MPRADCTACKHNDVALIDAALKAGASLGETAKRFGLSKAAVNRHHHHEDPKKSRINIGDLKHIDEQIKKLNMAQNRAKKKRNANQALAIARELRNWFVLRQKAIIASIGMKQDTPESVQVAPHELVALAKALIESRLDDREIQQWILTLAERIQATPMIDTETDEC